MRTILVMNLGSTSFKFKLYCMGAKEILLANGSVENIGGKGSCSISAKGLKVKKDSLCQTHMDALEMCINELAGLGMPLDLETLDAVGYKAVHGGSISGAHRVDAALMEEMERMIPLAPAHNPIYLTMMRGMASRYPRLMQIACFETAFHSTIPMERTVYGIPYAWVKNYGLRRYGFHGSSHSYIAWKLKQEAPQLRRIISIHLGGSSSLCAILDGKSIATSMGATPQSGLFHNNRVGDLDAFCLPLLIQAFGDVEKAMSELSCQSGLLGLSGISNDMQKVEEAAARGEKQAELAVNALAEAIVGYIGMYTAYLGGVDALCFTGGIGLNDAAMRERVVRRLGFIQAKLDDRRNIAGCQGRISAQDSGVEIWVLETNEEIMVARSCIRVLDMCAS